MVGNNKTNKRMDISDISVGESLIDNANLVGKAAWWALNVVGSASKVARVTVANSDIKAVRVIDDLGYVDVGIHGSNSGYNVIESVGDLFKSTKTKTNTTTGYGSLGKK